MLSQKNIHQIEEQGNLGTEISQFSNKKEDLTKEDLLIDLYCYYKGIVQQDKIISLIYRCLLLDIFSFFVYEYGLVENFSFTDSFYLGVLYMTKYFTSAINFVLCVIYIILSKNEDEKEKGNKSNKNQNNRIKQLGNNFTLRKYLKDSFESDKNIKENNIHIIKLNKSESLMKNLYRFKLITWFLRYFSYIIYMILNPYINALSYVTILVSILDYHQYVSLKFYYKVILRREYILNYMKKKSS